MRPAIEAVRATGTTVAEVALCYTGDLSNPDEDALHARLLPAAGRADRRGRRARAGDQGHGRAAARARRAHPGHRAARALRPAGPPAHPRHRRRPARRPCSPRSTPASTPSTRPAPRWPAPRRSRRCPRWSRPPTTPTRETGLSLAAVNALEPYWEAIRRVYAPFESGLPAPTGRVYRHEIPGGQLSNLRQQAIALGLGEKFEQVEDMYAAANDILGHIPKVTPSSKVVGDLALALVGARRRPGRVRRGPRQVRHPRLGDRLPQRRARRPARRLARAVPHQGARGPQPDKPPVGELTAEQAEAPRRRAARRAAGPSTSCSSPARPGSSPSRARSLRRRLGAADHRLPLRAAAAARSTRSSSRRARR